MSEQSIRPWTFERISRYILGALIGVVIIFQTLSIYTFPQPDGARWWGDETGQMLELRTELTTGFAHIPTGLGSSVAVTNGIVRGNSWMAAAIYGLPALVFPRLTRVQDIVMIGRFVTLLLAIVLFSMMARILFSLGVSASQSLCAVLVLVTSRSFFFASHAARLDVAAGLSVLGFAWYLSQRYDKLQRSEWAPTVRWNFLYGAIAMLFATLSIHLLTLLGLLSIYALWRLGAFRTPRFIFAALGGVALVSGVLLLIYAFSGAPWTLFGPTARPNQFQSVASMLPIQRPFSRSVQVANILERLSGLWQEAPAFLVLCVAALCIASVRVFRNWSGRQTVLRSFRNISFLSGSAITIAIAWLLFQSPALYYFLHVLPLFIVAIVVWMAPYIKRSNEMLAPMLILGILLSAASVVDSLQARDASRTITLANRRELATIVNGLSLGPEYPGPLVLAQNPAIAYLEHQRGVRLMTAHVVSFPIMDEPLGATLKRLGVDFILLYASHDGSVYSEDYNVLRPVADSIGSIVLKSTGPFFDVDRKYFGSSSSEILSNDTILLYELTRPSAR